MNKKKECKHSKTTSPIAKNLIRAIEATRAEKEFQISSVGLVNGQHDYGNVNLQSVSSIEPRYYKH
jgi:hypothetical protein